MKKIILIITLTIAPQISAQTIIENMRFENTTINWTKENSPYIIRGRVNFSSSTLNITDAKVIFEDSDDYYSRGSISLFNNSIINITKSNIEETSRDCILGVYNSKLNITNLDLNSDYFLQSHSSDVYIDNMNSSSSVTSDKELIRLYTNTDFSMTNSHIENHNDTALYVFNVNTLNIKNNTFTKNKTALELYYAKTANINKNDFDTNDIAVLSYMYENTDSKIDLENNFFQKDYKQIYLYESQSDVNEANRLIGPFKIDVFSKNKNVSTYECCSNILFLPGVMGSRLYMDGLTQNQLWEPNRNTDVKKLYLNDLGESINNIYTKDIIAKTNLLGGLPFVDKDIYKDFVKYLDQLKIDTIINDYNAMPYDWRMSADYVLNQGIKTKDKNIDLIQIIKDLQKTSKTNKVTIIAHSNGGLVTKQLIIELQKAGLDNMIDNIIFVAVPEYGTPQAITSLMFGHNQSLAGGLIMKSSIARELGKNMSTAYTLLPSEKFYKYITIADKLLQQTVVNNYSRINKILLDKAKSIHEELDNIVYSKNMSVYQIVGTGINTLSDITLDDKNMYKIIPLYSKNGDGVVLDMFYSRYGTTTFVDLSNTSYKHANIMNSDKVIANINSIINPKKFDRPDYGLDYNTVIKNDNYKLLRITTSKNKISEYLSPFDMDLSLGMSKLNNNIANELFMDKYHAATRDNFIQVLETQDNNNRFELYDEGINYLYSKDINELSINSRNNNQIDISILESIDGEINEKEYKDIPIFQNTEIKFSTDDAFQSLNIKLPLTNNLIRLENINMNVGTSTKPTQDEIITKIISDIRSSSMQDYLKDRYIRRIEVYKKNKNIDYLNTLKKKVSDAIISINKLSYSSILKARYSRTKEDYIYLNMLLLRL